MPAPAYHAVYVHGDVHPLMIVRDDYLDDAQKMIAGSMGVDRFYTAKNIGGEPTLTTGQKADFAAIQKVHGKTVVFP